MSLLDNPFWQESTAWSPPGAVGLLVSWPIMWPRASIVHLSIARQKQSWICQMGAKLPGRTNMFFSLPSSHKFSWQLLEFNDVSEFSSSLKCGWNWPEFLWGQEGVGGRESERENRAKNNNVWIFLGHLSWNIRKCNVQLYTLFFPTKDME